VQVLPDGLRSRAGQHDIPPISSARIGVARDLDGHVGQCLELTGDAVEHRQRARQHHGLAGLELHVPEREDRRRRRKQRRAA
jgi:hypothetical protein